MSDLSFEVSHRRNSGRFLKALFRRNKIENNILELDEAEAYLDAIIKAKEDLDSAQRLFDNASDPDLVEYAIYEQYAQKIRYSYLIKKAKEKNIKAVNYTL